MTDPAPEIVDVEPQEAIAVRGDVAVADLPGFFARAFHDAAEAAHESGVILVGPPFAFYPQMPAETVVVEAGFPVSAPPEAHGDAHPLVLPGGRTVQVVHIGPYDAMNETYIRLQAWMAEQGLHPVDGPWEVYLSDPQAEPDPAKWRTRIVWPVV